MRRLVLTLVTLAALLAAMPVHAQMTMLRDDRQMNVWATFDGLVDQHLARPPVPFGYWNGSVSAEVDNPDPEGSGFSESGASQISQVVGAGISASGGSSGSWYPPDLGASYGTLTAARFAFRLPGTVNFSLDAWLTPGTVPESGVVSLSHDGAGFAEYLVESGELHVTGRLGPGDYEILGSSDIYPSATASDASGAAYSYFFSVSQCTDPIIVTQPRDTSVACGSTPKFSVGTSVPAGGLTFQWRRNGVALVNGPHVSGASTSTLSLPGACTADTGFYEVRVSNGSVTEPSRVARLGIGGTLAVAPSSRTPGLALELAGPSPFASRTTLRYSAPSAGRMVIDVYDVTGARLRRLVDGEVAATGSVEWDGRSDAGARAAPGLYFVRIVTPGGSAYRSVVLMN